MRHWTKEELEYLDNSWGRVTIPGIAKKLGRSVNAVKLKAQKTGHTRHLHSGLCVTCLQLAQAINHDYDTVRNWAKYGLHIKKQASVKVKYDVIDIEDFWKWAESHKQLIKFDRIEPLVLGPEPEWVAEARRAAFAGKRSTSPWTSFDDDKLIHMLNEYKYSYSEIANELNRTEGAVKRRISTLGLKQRPVRRSDRKWTDNQVKILTDMVERGYTWEQIGKALGRTACAVRGKYERLNNPDYMKRYYRGTRDYSYEGASWRTKTGRKDNKN